MVPSACVNWSRASIVLVTVHLLSPRCGIACRKESIDVAWYRLSTGGWVYRAERRASGTTSGWGAPTGSHGFNAVLLSTYALPQSNLPGGDCQPWCYTAVA